MCLGVLTPRPGTVKISRQSRTARPLEVGSLVKLCGHGEDGGEEKEQTLHSTVLCTRGFPEALGLPCSPYGEAVGSHHTKSDSGS